ncbi:DUF262 domain-containing protein [Priestia megaterium]|uniref:DUF262 domain-containing protein n=1 Tax=Priestia megaterium TaxID=1404 RepID=UPI0010AB5DE0|nr:DUF262 domain-containing protein [Priestia megaterium]TJZ40061.1 DUF262 domain-containing protein [Priestia megaterium]
MANNELKTLVEIFNNSFFRIPDYQRGYAWQQDQLEDFWEDLENLKVGTKHYTGLITVEQIKKEEVEKLEKWQDDLWMFSKGFKAYYVIDGQQRLTTVIILLQSILNQFGDDEEINFEEKRDLVKKFLYQKSGKYHSFVFGYEKDNPSDEYFKTKILNQSSVTVDSVPEETLYTANLKRAKSFFELKLKLLSKEQLERIFSKVVNNLKFNLYEIDEELDVFVTFETMNNRGKPLSKLELLKNRLIYLTTLLEESESDRNKLRKDINDVWKKVYEYLGKNQKKPLDDDNFLKNHWIMYFKYDRSKSEAYADFLLNEYFTAKNVIIADRETKIGFQEIKNYIDSIHISIKNWFIIHTPNYSRFSDEFKIWLTKLNRIGFGAFAPLLLVSLNKNIEEKKLVELLKSMERFQFLVFRITRRASNTQNSFFYRLANDYHNEIAEYTIQDIIAEINWATEGKDDEGYYGWYDLDRFMAYISDQFRKESGYYSWNGLKYFLYEYELYLQKCANGDTKVSWERVTKSDSIEHILPQANSAYCWSDNLKGYRKSQKHQLLHSLGNLVLIASSKNSKLQNQCFEYKRNHRDAAGNLFGFVNGSYSEIEVAQYDEWKPEFILERGIKLLKFMENRWNIEIEDKEELLQLDFLKVESV